MGEPANRDFVIPDEPTAGDPPTNFLLIALPRDANDNEPRAYTIETVIALLTGGVIENRLASLAGDNRLSYLNLRDAPQTLTVEQITDEMSTVVGLLTGELAMKIVRTHETEPWVTLEQNVRYEPVGLSTISGRLEFRFHEVGGSYYFQFNTSPGHRLQVFEQDLHAPAVIAPLHLTDFTEYFRATVTGDYVDGRGAPVDLPDGWDSLITAEQNYHVGISQAIPPEDVVSLDEIRDEIDDRVESFAQTEVPDAGIPLQDRFQNVPIAPRGSLVATVDDISMNDGEFRVQTVGGQDYLKIYGLSAAEEEYLRSWEVGTLVEFYDNFSDERIAVARVNGAYDETNGLPLDTDTLQSSFHLDATSNSEYSINSTQPQPIRLVESLPDAEDALPNAIYAKLNADRKIVDYKGYIKTRTDKTAFFSFSPFGLLNGHRGYSTVAIAAYELPSAGTVQRVSGIDAITEQFNAGQGYRWIFAFPTGTNLVDADTAQLFLYTESGGDRIVLNRDTVTTSRIVFVSGYESTGTVSIGTDVNIGVWKDNNEPLIETSITAEDSYLEFDLRAAVGY